MLVDDLDLPTYVHSVLSRAGIERVSDLVGHTIKEFMAVPGLGQKSLEEIRVRLAEKGWALLGDEQADEEEGEELLGTGDTGLDDAQDDLLGGGDASRGGSRRGSRRGHPRGEGVLARGKASCRPHGALLYFAVAAGPGELDCACLGDDS